MSPEIEAILIELRALRAEIRTLRTTTPDAEAVTLEEAAQRLGCGVTRVYELLKDGVLERAPRIGRKGRVLTASLANVYRPKSVKPRRRAPEKWEPFTVADLRDVSK